MRPTRHTSSAEETESVAAEVALDLGPGDVVALTGDLGAGKTTFVRGACRGLGVEATVASPTFTIGRHYRGRIPVSHLDLYRLTDFVAEDPGLLDYYLDADAVVFVEWPSRAVELLTELAAAGRRLFRVEMRHAGGDNREIAVVRLDEPEADAR